MRKGLLIGLIAVVCALPSYAQGLVGVPTGNITPVAQDQTELCWAASSALLLDYYFGTPFTPEDVALRVHGNTLNLPGSDSDITTALNGYALGRVLHGSELPGMLTPQLLFNNLSTGHPVLVAIMTGPGQGHAVVVTAAFFVQTGNGLGVSSIIYRDPWPSPQNIATSGRVEIDGPSVAQFASAVRASWVTWVTF